MAKYLLAALGVVLLVLLAAWSASRVFLYHGEGKIAQKEPMDTTVCAIVENPAAFNNTMVRVKGHVNDGMEYSLLYGDGCDDPIWFADGPDPVMPNLDYVAGRAGSTDAQGHRVPPIPIKVVHDANFNKFKALMNARSQKSEQDWFSSQWVTATFVGRVDAGVSGNPHTAHGKRKSITGGNGGFGHENLFDAQFVLQSVQGDAVIGTARNGTTSLK
jgi:hypothetical protein